MRVEELRDALPDVVKMREEAHVFAALDG